MRSTVVASLEVIQVDSVMPRHKTEFYSNPELRAAIAVATRMVYRFRARRKARQLKQQQEVEQRLEEKQRGQPPPPQQQQEQRRAQRVEEQQEQQRPPLSAPQRRHPRPDGDFEEFEVEARKPTATSASVETVDGYLAGAPPGDPGTRSAAKGLASALDSSRDDFRLEGQQSEKHLKTRPPDASFGQKRRKPKQRIVRTDTQGMTQAVLQATTGTPISTATDSDRVGLTPAGTETFSC